MEDKELINLAKKAREFAYTKISGFKVGAAILTKEGKIYMGCNIEDPSGIGITNICAERCAIIKAISEGYYNFEKIAVVGGKEDTNNECLPCGACRQYLNSICPNIKIICINNEKIRTYYLKELLPNSFNEQFGNK